MNPRSKRYLLRVAAASIGVVGASACSTEMVGGLFVVPPDAEEPVDSAFPDGQCLGLCGLDAGPDARDPRDTSTVDAPSDSGTIGKVAQDAAKD
jgi:hypothetical protein